MSFFGGSTSAPYNISLSNQASRRRGFQEQNQQASLGYLSQMQRFYPDTVSPFINDFQRNQRARLENTGFSFLDDLQGILGQRRSDFDDGLAQYGRLGSGINSQIESSRQSARQSAQQQFDDTVRLQSSALNDSLTRRGFGGSTLNESGVASAIVPNALGGLVSAQASIDNAAADRATSFNTAQLGQYGNLLASRQAGDLQSAGMLGNFFNNLTNQSLGIGSSTFGAELGALTRPTDFAADRLTQPGVVFPDWALRSDIAGLLGAPQQSDSLLGGIGSSLLGSVTGGVGGALGQAAGGATSAGLLSLLG